MRICWDKVILMTVKNTKDSLIVNDIFELEQSFRNRKSLMV